MIVIVTLRRPRRTRRESDAHVRTHHSSLRLGITTLCLLPITTSCRCYFYFASPDSFLSHSVNIGLIFTIVTKQVLECDLISFHDVADFSSYLHVIARTTLLQTRKRPKQAISIALYCKKVVLFCKENKLIDERIE